MKKSDFFSKVIALVMSLTLIAAMTQTTGKMVEAQNGGKAIFSVEKFTIGEGFIVEPVEVYFTGETTVADIFKQVMDNSKIEYVLGDGAGFYLSEIKNADNGKYNIPEEIANMNSFTNWEQKIVNPPSNENNDKNNDNNLGEYDYSSMAGWLYSVNGEEPMDYASNIIVADGDVIRYEFSVYGWGADLGRGFGEPEALVLPKKEELLKQMAAYNTVKSSADENLAKCYEKALGVVSSYSVTQNEVDSMVEELKEALSHKEEVTTTNTTVKTTTSTTNTTVETTTSRKIIVKSSKIKNIKRYSKGKKAKLTFKKVSGAKYQIKYSTNKKFPKKHTRFTTSSKYKKTIVGLKAGKKYYFKVRTYKKIDGKKMYSRWSTAKVMK